MFYHPLTPTEGARWPFQSSPKSVKKVCLTCCYHPPRQNHQPPLHLRIFDSTWKREIHPTYSTLAFITIIVIAIIVIVAIIVTAIMVIFVTALEKEKDLPPAGPDQGGRAG